MTSGDDQALYLLPFDHRHSYITGMFQFTPPLSAQQHAQVCESKQIIYEGFQLAVEAGVPREAAGILVDEAFGSAVLREAHRRGFITALSTESSGSEEFNFEYGDDFARHIDAFAPTFAKALVRYNPEGDHALNLRQTARLKLLSDFCRASGRGFMFELLVPATAQQLAALQGDRAAYDLTLRPKLMVDAIHALQDAGIAPDLWKIEGLAERADCVRMVEAVRRGGRTSVNCIVLGRGADVASVRGWLATAASVPGFIGFAVGRTSFWDAIAAYRAQRLTRVAAAKQIAGRLLEWVDVFERGRLARETSAGAAGAS
jgi:myo-inositol catabolism protein IolC